MNNKYRCTICRFEFTEFGNVETAACHKCGGDSYPTTNDFQADIAARPYCPKCGVVVENRNADVDTCPHCPPGTRIVYPGGKIKSADLIEIEKLKQENTSLHAIVDEIEKLVDDKPFVKSTIHDIILKHLPVEVKK